MWKIKEYSDEFIPEIIEMTKEYYGENEISNIKFMKHQYFANPAGNAMIKLAYDDEKEILAGQYITIPIDIRINKQNNKAILSLNTLTRNAYRGQKIFVSLANSMFEECEKSIFCFCYGAPNPNSYPGFINKLKFSNVGEMPLYLKILSLSGLIKSKLKVDFLAKVGSILDPLFKVRNYEYKTYNIVEINEENAWLIDDFWEIIKDKYPIMVIRNKEYMLWRYVNIPLKEYKIFMAIKDGKPVGYAISRETNVGDMKCGMLVDFLFEKGLEEAGKVIIRHINKYFCELGIELTGCLMQSHFEEAHVLRKQGYFRCPHFLEPQPFPIILKSFNKEISSIVIEDFKKWFFTMGDYDAV